MFILCYLIIRLPEHYVPCWLWAGSDACGESWSTCWDSWTDFANMKYGLKHCCHSFNDLLCMSSCWVEVRFSMTPRHRRVILHITSTLDSASCVIFLMTVWMMIILMGEMRRICFTSNGTIFSSQDVGVDWISFKIVPSYMWKNHLQKNRSY